MDLTKILKVGDGVYTPLFGNIRITSINRNKKYSIVAYAKGFGYVSFTSDGKPYESTPECLLFPSKYNRDLNTWEVEKECPFKPFEKVLVRDVILVLTKFIGVVTFLVILIMTVL